MSAAWSPRARRTLGLTLGLAATLTTAVALAAPASAAPETDYEMPFPCGQSWTGTTRSNHSPSARSIDWNRIDDLGDPVVASGPGTVSVAEPNGTSGYGRWVTIDHAGAESTVYAHLSSVAVRAGQSVDQGVLIGTVGESGNATGPHLHYEQRRDRSDIAPWFHGEQFAFGSTQASQNCVDVPTAGDFLGGPEAELVVFRRADRATFQVLRAGKDPKVLKLGTSTDQPVVGDWDGDGRFNPGVRTPAAKTFRLKTPAGVTSIVFGSVGDQPVAGDWDGDGRWEVGVRRAGKSLFRLRAAGGAVSTVTVGDANDLPVTGDWDGDGRTDVGVFDVDTATFTLHRVDAQGLAWLAQVPFGDPGDLPVTGDWDGNLTTDLGVWDPSTATFSERRASSPMATRARQRDIAFGNPR